MTLPTQKTKPHPLQNMSRPVKKPKPKKHARYSSSSAERWVNCPASISLTDEAIKRFGPPIDSEAAMEGTRAHECLEDLFRGRFNGNEKGYPLEMEKHCRAAISWIREQVPEGAEFLIETKADLNFIAPDMGGTLDVGIVAHFDTLHVVDFKYGKGHIVTPERNAQMLSYALSVSHEYDYNFTKYKLTIYQPRAPRKIPHRSWECGYAEIKAWRKTLRRAYEKSLEINPPLNPGGYCYFCPAKTICPAHDEKALMKVQEAFND